MDEKKQKMPLNQEQRREASARAKEAWIAAHSQPGEAARLGMDLSASRELLTACIHGKRADRIQALLARRADPNFLNHLGQTPLSAAIENGNTDAFILLLPLADLTVRLGEFKRDYLMQACVASSSWMVQELLPLSDPLAVDARGQSALHLACAMSETGSSGRAHARAIAVDRIVEALLPVSDAERLDDEGWSPLSAAASVGREARVSELLRVCDPQAANPDSGLTPLMYAVANGCFEVARMLLPVSDPLAVSKAGKTALSFVDKESFSGPTDKGQIFKEMLLAAQEAASLRAALPQAVALTASKPMSL